MRTQFPSSTPVRTILKCNMDKDLIKEQHKLSEKKKKKEKLKKYARHMEEAGWPYMVEMSIFPN